MVATSLLSFSGQATPSALVTGSVISGEMQAPPCGNSKQIHAGLYNMELDAFFKKIL